MSDLHSVIGAKRLEALLRGRLADGTLLPGQKLPTEQELTNEFGLNRKTVRLVMIRLSAEGLIWAQHGSGYFVGSGRRRR